MGIGAGDVIGMVFLVAAVYIIVRPNSGAAQLVQALARLGVSMVRRATSIA